MTVFGDIGYSHIATCLWKVNNVKSALTEGNGHRQGGTQITENLTLKGKHNVLMQCDHDISMQLP